MTFREFSGKSVEEAVRAAMAEFGTDLSDLDVEILSAGNRGLLGVGGEDARILAAPRSAVAAAESVRAPAPPPAARRTAPEPSAAEPVETALEPQTDAVADDSDGVEKADEADGPTAESAPEERTERPPRRSSDGGRSRSRSRESGSRRSDGRAPSAGRPRTPREGTEPRPFVPAKPLAEMTEEERDLMERGKAVLEEMLRLMELDATVEIAVGQESAKLNVRGDELGVLIGRRGEKLASLQHIVNLIVSRKDTPSMRLMVDVENYRGRREDQLRDVASRAAQRVIQTGKIIQLEAMPAVERRIVHMALVENPKVRTQSVGVDPNRRIVILPANQAE